MGMGQIVVGAKLPEDRAAVRLSRLRSSKARSAVTPTIGTAKRLAGAQGAADNGNAQDQGAREIRVPMAVEDSTNDRPNAHEPRNIEKLPREPCKPRASPEGRPLELGPERHHEACHARQDPSDERYARKQSNRTDVNVPFIYGIDNDRPQHRCNGRGDCNSSNTAGPK